MFFYLFFLANNTEDTVVELVEPPAGAKIGERIAVEGFNTAADPAPAVLNAKKKEFSLIKPSLKTNQDKVACYNGIPLLSSAGPCTVKTLADSQLG